MSWDKKNKDKEDKIMFDWKDEVKDIKINLYLQQFQSGFMYFQNIRYRENMS